MKFRRRRIRNEVELDVKNAGHQALSVQSAAVALANELIQPGLVELKHLI